MNPLQSLADLYDALSSARKLSFKANRYGLQHFLLSLDGRHGEWICLGKEGEGEEERCGVAGNELNNSDFASARGAGKPAGAANDGDVRNNAGRAVGWALKEGRTTVFCMKGTDGQKRKDERTTEFA